MMYQGGFRALFYNDGCGADQSSTSMGVIAMSLDEDRPTAGGRPIPDGSEPRAMPGPQQPEGKSDIGGGEVGADLALVAPHRLRALSFAVDVCFVALAVGVIALVDLVLFVLVLPVTYAIYSGGLTWLTGGGTIGKALCGLVVRRVGPPVAMNARGLAWCVGRALALFFVDVLGIGTLTTFIDRRHRCLHDFVFGSEVVRVPEAELVPIRERVPELDEVYGAARDTVLRRAGVPVQIWRATTKIAGSGAAYVGWAALNGELPPGVGTAVRWAHAVADAATSAGRRLRDFLGGGAETPVASLPAASTWSPTAVVGTLVVSVPVSIGASIAIGDALRPDPLQLAGTWEVTEYVETENVDVVPADLLGAQLRLASLGCSDAPCPVELSEGWGGAERFHGLRFEPVDGGEVYEARWESTANCVDLDPPHAVVAEAAYDTTNIMRWERPDGGRGDDQLSFALERLYLLKREAGDCVAEGHLIAEFIAERRASQ